MPPLALAKTLGTTLRCHLTIKSFVLVKSEEEARKTWSTICISTLLVSLCAFEGLMGYWVETPRYTAEYISMFSTLPLPPVLGIVQFIAPKVANISKEVSPSRKVLPLPFTTSKSWTFDICQAKSWVNIFLFSTTWIFNIWQPRNLISKILNFQYFAGQILNFQNLHFQYLVPLILNLQSITKLEFSTVHSSNLESCKILTSFLGPRISFLKKNLKSS